jgi:hypothetical protein
MNKLTVVDYNGKRVLTTGQLAQAYGCNDHSITKNYSDNKDRFIEGEHFFKVDGDDLKNLRITKSDLQISPKTRSVVLWTRRGASRHCKMLGTDKAWEMFDELEETYFTVKETPMLAQKVKETLSESDKQKRAEAMLINARTRNAKLLAELAEKTNIGTYKNVLVAKAANVAVNEPLLELPPSGRPHHNLKYFCKMFGKKETWNFQLGKILCKEKVEKVDNVTGVWVEDKAEHNNSQRQNFEWYDDYLIPVLKKILHKEDN